MRISGIRRFGSAGTNVLDPIHKILAGSPVEVFNVSPGCKFSTATSPKGVDINDPRAKAQKALSNNGRAGTLCSAMCILSSALSPATSKLRDIGPFTHGCGTHTHKWALGCWRNEAKEIVMQIASLWDSIRSWPPPVSSDA